MENVVRIALVDPFDTSRESLKQILVGIDAVWLEAECSRYEFFLDVVSQSRPDIALVTLDADADKALALISQINNEVPECSVLVVSSSQEGSLILQAMRNGAREFLNLPLKLEDFLGALDRIRQTYGGKRGDTPSRSCRVYSIAGVSGGVGCTSVAINLACILASNERNSVAVIDLDLALGDADVWLDIIPDYTIQDVAENISRLDFSLLKRSLTRHDCGAFLLPRPVQMVETCPISADEFRRVVALLKSTFTHLFIDVSKSFSPLDLAAIDVSDRVLLTTQLDLPCLRNIVRLMQFFDSLDMPSDKIKVLVNRVGFVESEISMNKALETIGREIDWQVPNDYAAMVESRNNGIPLIAQAPRSRATKALTDIATVLDHLEGNSSAEDEPRKRRGLFRFLSSGSK